MKNCCEVLVVSYKKTMDKAIRALDAELIEWLVSGEDDDRDGAYKQFTMKAATAQEAKQKAERMGFSNVSVRKY